MKKIQISEVQIFPIKPKEGLVAFASCVINDFLYVGNIALFTSPTKPDGYRLVFPSKVLPNGKEINIFHPITKEAGEYISKAIIKKFQRIIEKTQKGYVGS